MAVHICFCMGTRTHGHCPRGRAKKKLLNSIRADCKEMGVTTYEALQLTTDLLRQLHWLPIE